MKKILTLITCLIASAMASFAADPALDVWGRGRYTSLGFVLLGNTEDKVNPRDYSSFGIFLNKGTTYLFPRGEGFGSFIKLGFDVRWVDLEVITYDSFDRNLTYSSNPAAPSTGLTRYPAKLDMHLLTFMAGALGIGPAVTFAPFSWADNSSRSIKLTLYAHYQPTFGLCAYRGTPCNLSGEPLKNLPRGPWVNEIAYVNLFDFGARLQWSRYSISIEGRRASARFPSATYRYHPADPFPLTPSSSPRYPRSLATTRLSLSF